MIKKLGECYDLSYTWKPAAEKLREDGRHFVLSYGRASVAKRIYQTAPGIGFVTAQSDADDVLYSDFNQYLRKAYPASIVTQEYKEPKKLPVRMSTVDEREQEWQSRIISSASFRSEFFAHSQRFIEHGHFLESSIFLYRKAFWSIAVDVGQEDSEKLIDRTILKERQRMQVLLMEPVANDIRRERVTEEVRNEVWRRDEGKCAKCGSRERLEFDHIVPVSRGGSNTTRNIELLCEICNRSKGNRI